MSVFFIRVWIDGDSIVAVRTGQGLITDAGDYGNATFIDAVAEGAYVDAGTLRPTLTYANNVLSSSLVTLLPAKDVTALLAQSGYGGQSVYNWADGNQYQWNGAAWGATPLTSQAVTSIAETEAGAAVAAISTKLVTAFKRSTTPPAAPSGGSYNFDSQVLTPPATWSATVPAGTDRLYLTQAMARVQAPEVIDDNISWGEPNAFSQDGEASISAFLTNEAHTVPADADGSNPDLTGATTDMRVFLGLDEDTQNWTFARTNSTGVTSTISDNTVTITGLTVDEGFVDITASKTGFSNITKRFTVSKSRAGADGADAKLITLTATGQVFTFTFDGTADPTSQTITFTADLQNTTDTVATWSTSPTVTLTGTGNTRSLTVANFGSNTSVTVTVTADSGAVTDKITIYRVKDGGTGDRGPGRWYIDIDPTIYNLPIAESQADNAWNAVSGSGGIPVRPSVYDQVIFYEGTQSNPTRQQAFICTSVTSDTVHTWNEQEELIDGDLLVTGTVTADRLVIGDSSLSSDASGGLLVQGGNITVLKDNFYTTNTPISGSGFSSPPNASDLSLVGGNSLSVPAGFTADLQVVVTFEHGYYNLPGFNDDWGLRILGGFSGQSLTELYARYNPTMTLETDFANVVTVARNLVNPSSSVATNYNIYVYWGGGSSDIQLLDCLSSVFVRFK
jgi:hypothetical protein